MPELRTTFNAIDALVHRWLVRHSIMLLRVSVGFVFLAFGVLKYVPGVSPAQDLVEATTHILFLGLVPGGVALVFVATLECAIGLMLVTGRGLRIAMLLLGGQFVGILSPLVLLPGRLFAGPHHAPTLEGQYVIKDIVLLTAAMVIATALRGGKLVPGDYSAKPAASVHGPRRFSPRDKLAIVLAGLHGDRPLEQLLERHGISEGQYEDWRDETLDGATKALATHEDTEDDTMAPGGPEDDQHARRLADRDPAMAR